MNKSENELIDELLNIIEDAPNMTYSDIQGVVGAFIRSNLTNN